MGKTQWLHFLLLSLFQRSEFSAPSQGLAKDKESCQWKVLCFDHLVHRHQSQEVQTRIKILLQTQKLYPSRPQFHQRSKEECFLDE